MDFKTKIINFEMARKKRRMQRIKTWLMNPTVVAFALLFTIYGIIVSGHFIHNNVQSKHSIVKSNVSEEMDNMHSDISK